MWWKANLLILENTEVKTVSLTLVSHPFVAGLVDTVRHEFPDHAVFRAAADLERKLAEFRHYYNTERAHNSLGGVTPVEFDYDLKPRRANLSNFKWKLHCRGTVDLPIAA